jgi:hypothetical protein
MYGLFTMHSNQLAAEVCSSEEEFNMCPLCDINVGCNFWNLSEVCSYAQFAYLFDHPGTVFYAVFMSFWGEHQLLNNVTRLTSVMNASHVNQKPSHETPNRNHILNGPTSCLSSCDETLHYGCFIICNFPCSLTMFKSRKTNI